MRYLLVIPVLAFSACDMPDSMKTAFSQPAAPVTAPAPASDAVFPEQLQGIGASSDNALSPDAFDRTTQAERQAAAAPAAGGRALGVSTGSLGAPTDPGFWVKTPLVKSVQQGRVQVVSSGKSANVELRPAGGPAGGGSQISLAAMRVLGEPLTALPQVQIFAQ